MWNKRKNNILQDSQVQARILSCMDSDTEYTPVEIMFIADIDNYSCIQIQKLCKYFVKQGIFEKNKNYFSKAY